MRDRMERVLRVVCAVLALLVAVRLTRAVVRATTLHNVAVPALPRLATNTVSTGAQTNAATNLVAKSLGTNAATGTNLVAKPATNAAPSRPRPSPRMGMAGPRSDDLPAPTKKQVDKIIESEILAPFMRPMPMALLGIADDSAFLRAPDGQSGAVKEGGQLGTVKLLRIGVNRVLVEEDGEKKELTLFDGLGGKSLLPPPTNTISSVTNVPAGTNAAGSKPAATNAAPQRREKS